MLSQRLDKLETDLKILNSMQDILLKFETEEDDDEVEMDSAEGSKSKSSPQGPGTNSVDDNNSTKDESANKISEYVAVIRRMKELLLTLRSERDKGKRELQIAQAENHELFQKQKIMLAEQSKAMEKVQRLERQIADLSREKTEKVEGLQTEKLKLEEALHNCLAERKKCMDLLAEMKQRLANVKNKAKNDASSLQSEQENLRAENKRLEENFRVIQKVSEDQGHTIQKLRSEVENLKSSNFKLESDSRDYERMEGQLTLKLDQANRKIDDYLSQIENLEDKVHKYDEEIRTHDCDEYVDSKYKRKLHEVEDILRAKTKEWESSLKEVREERDEAVQTSKKTLQKLEELQENHTSHTDLMKSKFQTAIAKLTEQHKKQDTDNQKKIQDLQSELGRIKLSSSQIQRALSTKIQQLQAALSICIGGSARSTSNGSSNLNLGLLHQLHSPVAAFGDIGSVNNNDCSNNNEASASIVNLLLNSAAIGGIGGPGASGGESCSTDPNNLLWKF